MLPTHVKYSGVTVIVEVAVDAKTGEVKVNKAVVGQDMGQVIPLVYKGLQRLSHLSHLY